MPLIRVRSSRHARFISVALAVVLVGLAAAAGLLLYRHSSTPRANAAPACTDDPMQLATRDKLAQLLMVGVTGTDDAAAVVRDHHVGGIFIGSWTDLAILGSLGDITTSGGPLQVAVSVDEEGGRVDSLASVIGPAPSARALAANSTPDEVYAQALQRGQAMRNVGITVDFAPVVDVSDQPDDSVIGDRSFSDDPEKVTAYAGAYARGLRDAGVLPVLKHFPGHGHGSGDTHTGAVVTPPLDQLERSDLVPYRPLVGEPEVAVMLGHLQVPGLTGDQPASLSPAAYALLRSGSYGAPGFGGLVFTDDLSSMRAISSQYGIAQAALMALQAGADNALWVTTDEVPAVLDRLEAAVASGELNAADVDAKVQKLAAFKGRNPSC